MRLATTLRAHAGALAVGVTFLLLSVLYSIAIPAWEADNELSHFNYVRYIVERRSLPRVDAQISPPVMVDVCRSGEERILTEMTHQFRQPPLYYLLGALATGWINTDSTGLAGANPFRMWDPTQLGYNFALHDPAQEGPPYHGTLLALHGLRLFSGLVGLLGLAATYMLGLLLFDGRRPLTLAMMAVNAFLPQYLFASAIISNDILVAALSSWCIFWCAYVVLRAPRMRFLLLAALTAGLAILAKYNGIVLLALVALAALAVLASARRASGRRFAVTLVKATLLIVAVGIPSWLWLLRNQTFYGQGLNEYITISNLFSSLSGGSRAWSVLDLWEATRYVFSTFWGQFGWDTLTLPPVIIAVLAVVTIVAGAGSVLILADPRQSRRARAIVLAAGAFLLLTVLQSYLRAAGSLEPRGRYLLPALSLICFLLVAGWYRILPERYKVSGIRALWMGMLALAVATPFVVLAPAYAPPRLEATAELAPGEQPLHATIGGFAELVGFGVEPQRLVVGEPVEVTLVWRALHTTTNNYTLSIHLLDGDKYPRAWVMSHPGRGNFPTSVWQPGDVFRDRYTLYWAETPWERLPSLATIKVALFCPASAKVEETNLDVVDAQGRALGDAVYFGRIKVVAQAEPLGDPNEPVMGYTVGDDLALDSLELPPGPLVPEQDVTLNLHLRALRQPAADYAVFAHIVDGQGQQVGGNDQPLTGGYYPSSLWEPGEAITHAHHLRLTPLAMDSRYEIHMGLYDPDSGQRLPLVDQAGQRMQDDRIIAAVIHTPKYRIVLPVIELGYRHNQ